MTTNAQLLANITLLEVLVAALLKELGKEHLWRRYMEVAAAGRIPVGSKTWEYAPEIMATKEQEKPQ